jgi:putative transposase
VKFAFIDAEKACFPVEFMCRQFSVSSAGYYAWLKREPSARALDEVELTKEIEFAFAESGRTSGSPRVHAKLRKDGRRTSRKRVARIMREKALAAREKRRFRRTTNSNHSFPIAENILNRAFKVDAPDKVWVTDITYIETREGWLYLAAIVDLFSRKVVGWAMSKHIDTQLCLDALKMALLARKPPPGLIHHSDRGCQYASHEYRRLLEAHGIICSMSRRGDCWDNAVAESFWSSLKMELVYQADFISREQARQEIFKYIEVFYNRYRLHSSIAYHSPVEYEFLYSQNRLAA